MLMRLLVLVLATVNALPSRTSLSLLATRRSPANGAKCKNGQKNSGAYGAGNHHQISPHIFNMSL